ncbi:hypothetical protein N7495_002132 [Penicillium taxi]|uniref:uncharacterized protein n=1 Tax=Penicillium taxi TaxID=168475 RepID=UPI0025450B5D|nr:uncharacterized protein N7495_002132 [Penicillium taxi]KAJ5901604.1 hypothetical protein N7495_002132 [Penicillium taxi]
MLVDDSAKAALRGLQEMTLLHLEIDVSEEAINFLNSTSGIDLDSVIVHVSPDPLKYAFYRPHGADGVIFIYTKLYSQSVKHRMVHSRATRTIIATAQEEGLKISKKVTFPTLLSSIFIYDLTYAWIYLLG